MSPSTLPRAVKSGAAQFDSRYVIVWIVQVDHSNGVIVRIGNVEAIIRPGDTSRFVEPGSGPPAVVCAGLPVTRDRPDLAGSQFDSLDPMIVGVGYVQRAAADGHTLDVLKYGPFPDPVLVAEIE